MKFNEMNNIDMNISGLKCDSCDYSDDSVKLEDYEKVLVNLVQNVEKVY